MKRFVITMVLSLCANQLYAMKAAVLPEGEDADLVGRFQRLEYLEQHKFDNNPSKEELFRRMLDIEAVKILDYERQKSPLYVATLEGDAAKVTALVNPPGDGNFSPLHWAAGLNHDGEGVKILIAAGADVNLKREDDGVTPLHIAKAKGAIDALLDNKADIESRDKEGWTPLYTAVYERIIEAVKALCDCGANLEAPDNEGKIVMGAGPKLHLLTPFMPDASMPLELRKLLFDYWQPHFEKRQAEHMKKLMGFK